MNTCVTCRKGNMVAGYTIVTLHKDDHIFSFKQVPASICDTCGDYTLSMDVAEALLKQAANAESRGVELEIQQYQCAS